MATLFVLYGSATGNAEGIAKDLAEKEPPSPFTSVVCKPLGDFKKFAKAWEEAPPSPTRKHGVIIVCSTTGNADPPENASRFFRFIKRKPTGEALPFQHVAYSILGLGDTNYDQFCAMGKLIDKKMAELGGERAKALACADEATGLEEVVEPWLASVHRDMSAACLAADEAETTPELKEETTETPASEAEPTILRSKSDTPLYIMYGSVTGNAESIAKDLAASYEMLLGNPDAHTFFPSVICCELNQFKKHLPTWEQENAEGGKHGVLMIASSTGNGNAPENAERFVRFIKRKQTVETQPFRHVKFAVLGLGDSNYDQFCATGKEIDKRMSLLGGTRAKPLACADEGTGLEHTVDPWTNSVFTDISNACRGGAAQSGGSTTRSNTIKTPQEPKVSSATDAEEKKSETADVEKTDLSSNSPGVVSIKALLKLDSTSPIPAVPHSSLPSLGATRSSCELFNADYEQSKDPMANFADNATISTSSSGAALYTQSRPYESTIVGARYLTKTSTEAAAKITTTVVYAGLSSCQDFRMAREVYESAFPLDGPNAEENERNGKRVVELTLSLPDDFSLEFQPGDTIGLLVPNELDSVAFVLQNLREHHGILPSQKVSIDEGKPITVEEAIRENVDLCCTLRNKKILNGLSQFATNEEEAAALRLMASKDSTGLKLFQEYIVDQRRSFTNILRDFPSCRSIPLEGILSILTAIPPRYYSISSSPLDTSKNSCLSIAFSVVDYQTPSLMVNGTNEGHRRIHGMATSFLEAACAPFLSHLSDKLKAPPLMKIFPKPTADFRLPSSLSTPMILVGPGTGIAPFMGFLAHRKAMLSSRKSNDAASAVVEGTWRGGYELEQDDLPLGDKDAKGLVPAIDYRNREVVGNVEVYFGCRHMDHDWLFEEEMKQCKEEGIISELHTAFSRGSKKQYVQHLMKEPEASRRLVKMLLEDNGRVYICGDGNSMASDVQNAIAEILGSKANGEVDVAAGKAEIDNLKKDGRFLLDIWS